jgi:hypothetical protein
VVEVEAGAEEVAAHVAAAAREEGAAACGPAVELVAAVEACVLVAALGREEEPDPGELLGRVAGERGRVERLEYKVAAGLDPAEGRRFKAVAWRGQADHVSRAFQA